MRAEVCSSLGVDLDWAEKSFELTPYKFNLLEAMAARLGDMDVGLCAVLKEGAPTGVGAKYRHQAYGHAWTQRIQLTVLCRT